MDLKKSLGGLDIFSIAAGAMISSGLFILPGLAFAKAGPAVILAYLLAGILVIPSMLSKAELATAMPKAGGTYFFIERSLGTFPGMLGGMASWFSISFKSAFALAGMGAFGILIFPRITEFQMDLIAVSFCLLFTLLNLFSVKHTGRFQIILVFLLLSILTVFLVPGLQNINVHRFDDFTPHGLKAVFATVGLIFVSFGGLTKVASVAEDTKNPGRNIPRGMAGAYIVVCLFYVLVTAVVVGVVPGRVLAHSLTPVSLAARELMGIPGYVILSVAAMLAFITTANAGLLSASRVPLAMSRDQLFPAFFRKVHSRYHTPFIAILITSAFMICVILFLDLETLVKTASTMMILLFMSVNIAVIIMRASKIQSYRPTFRAPFYPWLQIASVVVFAFLIFEMGAIPLLITGGFILLGSVWYLIYARPRVRRQSAFMCLVGKSAAPGMACPNLETELKNILIERDEIVEDRFDRMIKECPVLEFKQAISARDAFAEIARILSPRLRMPESELLKIFLKREEESSTVLRPGLAIPHILIEGEKKFHLLLVRGRPGVIFPGTPEPVPALFLLVGTQDERNYHLRVLMAIAQITEEKGFDRRWKEASGPEELRHILLLSARRREGD